MGSKSSNSKHQNLHHFSSVLSSAFLEWALMVLLFLNGFFSYLVTKFAQINKLKPPCLLCSRLDHLIEPNFNRDSLCDSHKLEISSWVFCHIKCMCEKCLFSLFSGEKWNDICIYRSFLGNVGTQVKNDDVAQVPLLEEDNEIGTTICSCCNEPIKQYKDQVFRLFNDMRRIDRDEIESIGINEKVILEKDTNQLTHVEYDELKTSDSDSELHVNDTLVSSREIQINDIITDNVTINDDRDSSNEKPILDENYLNDSIHAESHCTESQEKENDISNELLREDSLLVNLEGEIEKETPTITEDKITSLNEPPTLSPTQNPNPNIPSRGNSISLNDAYNLAIANESPKFGDIITDKDNNKSPKYEDMITRKDSSRVYEPSTLSTTQNQNPNIPSRSNSISLNDAYNLAIGNKSPKFGDIITGKDSSRVYEELKLLISQISNAQGLDSPWNNLSSSPSPRLNQGDEHVLFNISKTLSLERNESLISRVESWEGSLVSEVEGESSVDRFKRQVDLDRKSISLLYKELEEERSASAIAANQAMAMITRLQEEKAGMQMEALQYQRMMEEQAEYDQEAIQNLTQIISQKDKTIQELESELSSYRDRMVHNWGDLSSLGFEEQKEFISNKLSELEEKLHLFSNNSSFIETTKLNCIEEVEEEEDEEEREIRSEKESFRRENETREILQKRESLNNLGDLEKEISQIYERLKALEADHNFLEHSLNSIKNGQEGVRFIYDIALSLQELRSLGITHGNKDT